MGNERQVSVYQILYQLRGGWSATCIDDDVLWALEFNAVLESRDLYEDRLTYQSRAKEVVGYRVTLKRRIRPSEYSDPILVYSEDEIWQDEHQITRTVLSREAIETDLSAHPIEWMKVIIAGVTVTKPRSVPAIFRFDDLDKVKMDSWYIVVEKDCAKIVGWQTGASSTAIVLELAGLTYCQFSSTLEPRHWRLDESKSLDVNGSSLTSQLVLTIQETFPTWEVVFACDHVKVEERLMPVIKIVEMSDGRDGLSSEVVQLVNQCDRWRAVEVTSYEAILIAEDPLFVGRTLRLSDLGWTRWLFGSTTQKLEIKSGPFSGIHADYENKYMLRAQFAGFDDDFFMTANDVLCG